MGTNLPTGRSAEWPLSGEIRTLGRQRRMAEFDPYATAHSFVYPQIWNIGGVRLHHSGLMLAARITLPHFSVSSATNLANSEGEPVNSCYPVRQSALSLWIGEGRIDLPIQPFDDLGRGALGRADAEPTGRRVAREGIPEPGMSAARPERSVVVAASARNPPAGCAATMTQLHRTSHARRQP